MKKESNFWKLVFGSGGVTACNVLRAFLINKLLAVFLPPSMFACVGQLQNLMTMGQATSSLAMQNGWVSLTAQNRKDREKLVGIWHGGFRMTTYATIFTCILAVFFCFMAPLHLLFPGIPTRLVQAAILFSLPGILAMNIVTITSSVMNGLGEYRRWALIGILASFLQCVWVAFFLYSGRLSVLSIIATQSVVAGVVAAQIASRAGFSFNVIRRTALDTRSPWFSFAIMGIVPMVLSPVVLTVMRSFIGNEFGWEAAGIWQGIWKISDFFAVGFSAILGVVLLPKISRELSKKEFWATFNPILFKMFGITFVVVAILFACRQWVVAILLSSSYAGAADYMPLQLVGDFFRTGGWALGLVLIARQETFKFLMAEIFSNIYLTVGTIVFSKLYEFSGPILAYASENILYFVALYIVVRRLKWKNQ
ncbi:O-antigen translocase [Fibrobacter sp.]|uniref:O-antigen translocase n=1 Tax=Fibrobacter sp. TaxID=35828 RepID=UPI00388F3C6C